MIENTKYNKAGKQSFIFRLHTYFFFCVDKKKKYGEHSIDMSPNHLYGRRSPPAIDEA
jgi:hypothetical protein